MADKKDKINVKSTAPAYIQKNTVRIDGADYDVESLPKVTITHTLTSAFCPEADLIVSDIRVAASQVEGVDDVRVITTFDPPFGPNMMSEEAKLALGI